VASVKLRHEFAGTKHKLFNMANTKAILGFIAGASIGAIIGILMAPEKGADTRQKIIDKSGDLKDAIKESITGFLDKLQKGVDEEVSRDDRNIVPKMGNDIS
jgi:gas vesicle protein